MTQGYLIPENDRPGWLVYPPELISMVAQGKTDLTPWHFMKVEWIAKSIPALFERYGRIVVPFAHRQNNDDIAVFEKGSGDKVLVIHNFAEKGNEIEEEYPTFQGWLESAEADSMEWQ